MNYETERQMVHAFDRFFAIGGIAAVLIGIASIVIWISPAWSIQDVRQLIGF